MTNYLNFQRMFGVSPGHAAVDAKVDGIGEADEHIDEEDDLVGHLVVKKLHQAETGNHQSKTFSQQKPINTLKRLCGEGQGLIEGSQR